MLQDLFHTQDSTRMKVIDEEHASQPTIEEIIDEEGVFNGMPNLATAQAHEAQLQMHAIGALRTCGPMVQG
ncbi:hypothetical protein R1flu_000690 [Riccia fluitans]|uniref:Uncharacterized protein n=1 Tax=Riccia fluitans TaxID=41844 RepID=A0ABD1Y167_9MARC